MKLAVYLEVGTRRTFACAVEWPGWCRSGRGAEAAVEALVGYGPRYASAIAPAAVVDVPGDVAGLEIVDRLPGDASTDFGTPGGVPDADTRPLADELDRLTAVLEACWLAFDRAAAGAAGTELAKGPRGGGRELDGIVDHVVGAERSYLRSLSGDVYGDPDVAGLRRLIMDALERSARGELPPEGPRGGRRWPGRYFIRRSAWHSLDHAWEIGDRSAAGPS